MRPVRKKLRDGAIGEFVVSDRSGPMITGVKSGTDNLITNKVMDFEYIVAKPYTSILTPVVDPITDVAVFEDRAVSLTAPTPAQILHQFDEDLWLNTFNTLFADIETFASNNAIEKCLAYGDLLMYVTASEARQTIIMVRNVFIRLAQSIMEIIKRAKKLNLPATLDVFSDLWLEYRYGWRPFIGEVQALKKVLTEIRIDGIKTAYGLSQNELETPAVVTVGETIVPTDQADFLYEVQIEVEKVSAKAGFNYLNSGSSRNDDWLAKLGLDLESIASTVWDMIPFSFVVDMFFNVGSVLQTQNSSEQVDSFNHYRTRHSEGKVQIKCKSITLKDGSSEEFDLSRYLKRSRVKLADWVLRKYKLKDPYDFDTWLNHHITGEPAKVLNFWENRLYGAPKLYDHYLYPVKGYLMSNVTLHNTMWPEKRHCVPYQVAPTSVLYWLETTRLDKFANGEKRIRTGLRPSIDRKESTQLVFPDDAPGRFFLASFDFADMSHTEAAHFFAGMVSEVPSIYKQTLINTRTRLLNSGLNETIVKLDRASYGFHGMPNGYTWTNAGDPATKYFRTWRHYSYMLGHSFNEPPTTNETYNRFDYELPVKVFTRRLAEKFSTEFTVDVELNTAQWADLGALGWSFVSRYFK